MRQLCYPAWIALSLAVGPAPLAAESRMPGDRLTDEQVARFAQLALDGIPREFPNKPSNVMTGPESVLAPRQMHPVFFGSFDWHSSVHGHWMLVRLAKEYPDSPVVAQARALLDRQFTEEGLAAEAAYFADPANKGFERMYGWAWTLRLAAELRTWDDPDARRWAAHLLPLEQQIVALTKDYLPRLTYPIRTGVHPDTAFALGQTLDYARAVDDAALEAQVVDYCRQKYLADRDYPARYEPSGEDFFSAGWNEADLMRRVLPADEFAAWLTRFFPHLTAGAPPEQSALAPAVVSDVTDPRIVHLAGLNLSRGWTQNGVLAALPADDPRRPLLQKSVAAHTRAGLDYVFSGHYEGEHWLATFAVYLLTETGAPR
ncbi:hypothetical protein Pla175_36910 [Pirellulimonas nuda]|uniref:DUF2891 domain-containing protein n=1 Tax=Pirellulimonas nuda TaxID=2528009 RepID=A0A518DFQ6_9BACT|nr:DUF2891 domain-containing protein [Pirellulimonas nuda]QDU90288.1 hypothetical protein Pla175_36910 [Pirellulimonas nuda]